MDNIQNVLFPINNDENTFIYPKSLKDKLPKEAIDCIKPSMKIIHPYTIQELQKFNDQYTFNICPQININFIKSFRHLKTKVLTLKHNVKFENHFLSDKNKRTDIESVLNTFLNNSETTTNYKTKPIFKYKLSPICSIKLLREYENKYNFRYLIIDKLLGIGIIENEIILKLINEEIDKILIQIKDNYDPQYIKRQCILFVYEHQCTLMDYNQIPNKTLQIISDDVKKAKNGFFHFNPLYKAHKYEQKSPNAPKIHIPKIRPVISGLQSPLLPILKLIANGCMKIIHILQLEYNITNIIQDSYHVINIFEEYRQKQYHPNDYMVTFDYTSFYTEIPKKLIINKLTAAYHIFKNKYQNTNDKKYNIYAKIIIMIIKGYKLAAKYSIININDKLYVQKQGVIMGVSFAPSLANLIILMHIIEKEIYKCILIKIIIRQIDDTMMICTCNNEEEAKILFANFSPKELQFTVQPMINNKIKFLDILFIKINDEIEYVMQIKPLKTEFYIPYKSNHPLHIKINVITNMIKRAMILSSNQILFHHTVNAIRIRFIKSGYPISFLNKFINESIYEKRQEILSHLNDKRYERIKNELANPKIKYSSIFNNNNDRIIKLPYDKSINKAIKCQIKRKYPNKFIVQKLNKSIQRLIRAKNANKKVKRYKQ